MRLTLGARSYELVTTALVVGRLGADAGEFEEAVLVAAAHRLIAEGADVVELCVDGRGPAAGAAAVGSLVRALPAPVAVDAASPDVAAAAVRAGAHLVRCEGRGEPGYLAAAAASGAAVVVACPPPAIGGGGPAAIEALCDGLVSLARAAERAGIPPDRIAVDGGVGTSGAPADRELLLASKRLASLGYPLVLSLGAAGVPSPSERTGDPVDLTVAAASIGVGLGCRLVRTAHATAVRRTCDVLAAVRGAA